MTTPTDTAADYSAVDRAFTTAEAAAEQLRVKAQDAARAAADADRVRMDALSDKQAVRNARAADVHRQIATVATERIQAAAADQANALEEFRGALVEAPWALALIKWMGARQKIRAWDLRQMQAMRALGSPSVDSAAMYQPGPSLAGEDLAEMLAQVIAAAGITAANTDATHVDDARARYVNGDSDDPTPPAGT